MPHDFKVGSTLIMFKNILLLWACFSWPLKWRNFFLLNTSCIHLCILYQKYIGDRSFTVRSPGVSYKTLQNFYQRKCMISLLFFVMFKNISLPKLYDYILLFWPCLNEQRHKLLREKSVADFFRCKKQKHSCAKLKYFFGRT